MAVSDRNLQHTDPSVSRTKFNREIDEYRAQETDYRSRGWFLIKADWPTAEIVLISPKTAPPAVVLSVRFDYTNYDVEPPSVRFINPFTGQLLLSRELPVQLLRTVVPDPKIPTPTPGPQLQPLMQAHSLDEVPFFCIPGVKEYHDHPGHSGDPWEMHRSNGEGRLVHLLGAISKYGLEPVVGFGINMSPQVVLQFSEPPQ